MKRILALLSFFAFPVGVLAAHTLVSALHLYALYPNLDIPFHFMGGFSIAYMAAHMLAFLEKEGTIAPLSLLVLLLLAFSLTATATVLWEFAEFGADQLLGTNVQVSLANTMQDQFFGLCGGTTWVFIHAMKQRRAIFPRPQRSLD